MSLIGMLLILAQSIFAGHDHDESSPQEFTDEHVRQAVEKSEKRFRNLNLPDAEITEIAHWKTATHIWVLLSYQKASEATQFEMINACHLHGAHIGCHKKTSAPAH